MKKSPLFSAGIIVVSLLMAISLTACEVTTASLSEATMCRSVDNDMRPVDATDIFTTDTPEIFCSVKLSYAPADTEVKAEWIYVQGEVEDSQLYELMGTEGNNGITYVWDYGPGFVDMTERYLYTNFEYYWTFCPGPDFYWNIRDYIDRGYPTALCAWRFGEEVSSDVDDEDFPPPGSHFVAIKGYDYDTSCNKFWIICTDSYSGADWLYLDWTHVGLFPGTCTIWTS